MKILEPINWNALPDEMSKEQFRIICRISKATAAKLLKSGIVPCIHSGKKTRCYTIRKTDVQAYLKNRKGNITLHDSYDKNSTILFDSWHTHVGGIFVDVFPIDGAADGNISNNYKHFIFWQNISRYSHLRIPRNRRLKILKAGGYRGYLLIALTSLFRKPLQKISVKIIEKTIRKYPFEGSKYCLFYYDVYGLKHVVERKWIEETILVPFEDIEVRIPKCYQEYLSHIYGDYMTPPPVDKRDDRHVFAFLDMEKRWTLDDIRKELSKE